MSLFIKTDSLFNAELKAKIYIAELKNIGESLQAETETIAGSWQCEYTDQFRETMEQFIREMETAYEKLSENLPAFLKASAELYEQTEKDVAANAQQFKNVRTGLGKGTAGTTFTSAEQATTFTAKWQEGRQADSSVHTGSSGQTHGGSGSTVAEGNRDTAAESSAASPESGSTSAENSAASPESGSSSADWISQVAVSVGTIAKGIIERVIAEQTGAAAEGSEIETTVASGDNSDEQESVTDVSGAVTAARTVTEEQRAAMDSVSDQKLFDESGYCNIYAVTNLLRRRQILDGKSVEDCATVDGVKGINEENGDDKTAHWSSALITNMKEKYGYSAKCEWGTQWKTMSSEEQLEKMKELLEAHPEGIVIYLDGRSNQHGIVLTEYVEGVGFKVADSGNNGNVTWLTDSYSHTNSTMQINNENIFEQMKCIYYLE